MNVLIVVDVQNGFFPNAPLGVPGADEKFVEDVNNLTRVFDGIVVASQDWHPHDHSSFEDYGGPWPRHCVAGTYSAKFHEKLETTNFQAIIRKGFRKEVDSYSAFKENDGKTDTGLYGYLATRRVNSASEIFVCGLALDFCVKWTAEDALILAPNVRVITGLTRAVFPENNPKTYKDLTDKGIKLV